MSDQVLNEMKEIKFQSNQLGIFVPERNEKKKRTNKSALLEINSTKVPK